VGTRRPSAYPAARYLASVSGGPGSLVPRSSLDWEGQRFLAGAVPAREIERVVEGPARDPIRVYVGLRDAGSPASRARLAAAELERLGAHERRRIVVASPTGMGYLDPVPIETEECLQAGDVATVVVQYADRRSYRATRLVPVGRDTHRAVIEILASPPTASRPELAVFAESLGAWASLLAMEELTGGKGLDAASALGVERGLWVGVPYAACALQERLLRQSGADARAFAGAAALRALDPAQRRGLRHVFMTRPDDPVATFAGPRAGWRHPARLLRDVLEVKRSTDFAPGRLDASGHDYRGELGEVVALLRGDFAPGVLERLRALLLHNEERRAATEAP
jgi:uncharacterized membrane protein